MNSIDDVTILQQKSDDDTAVCVINTTVCVIITVASLWPELEPMVIALLANRFKIPWEDPGTMKLWH